MQPIKGILNTLRQHREILHDRYKVQQVGVFGSYARGDIHSGSDVDIIVEFYEPISLLALVSLENYLSDILGTKADVVPKEDIRIEMRERILREAVYA